MAKHGGNREGAGRKKNNPDVGLDPKLSKGFATRVLSRIKELKLLGPDGKPLESAEDYALQILAPNDAKAHTFFDRLLDREFGKPVQPTIQRDTRENRPEVDFDGLAMPAGSQPAAAGKPN